MLIRTLAAIGLLSTLAMPVAAAATFVQATALAGIATVIVNLQDGNIFACPNLTSVTGVPLGDCTRIGAIGLAGVGGLASNVQITVSNSNAAITNLTNGHVQLCSFLMNVTTSPAGPTAANLIGSCKRSQAF